MSTLHDFIVANRTKIIDLARQRVRESVASRSAEAKSEHGIPLFLTQLADAMSAPSSGTLRLMGVQASQRIAESAALHGRELLEHGFTVAQVVHGYGDVCQIVTALAVERNADITAADFHTFNRCLDDAIAGAVTAYGHQREREVAHEGTERLEVLAHELSNLLHAAGLSFEAIRGGTVGVGGSTGALHARSLAGLRALAERSLAELRLESGVARVGRISVAEFLAEIEGTAALQAERLGLSLTVNSVEGDVVIDGDRELLASAVLSLLQNAFKFSRAHGSIALTARVAGDRLLLEVHDECGGLPEGMAEKMFLPFVQGSHVRPGRGVGLSIARSAARANSGELCVRDVPGKGCVFTIDLPRSHVLPASHLHPAPGLEGSEEGGTVPAAGGTPSRLRN